ncbi:UNVERIFIED_CONTAM: hypothetical protein K2H54_059947 [Gekko kuhli]
MDLAGLGTEGRAKLMAQVAGHSSIQNIRAMVPAIRQAAALARVSGCDGSWSRGQNIGLWWWPEHRGHIYNQNIGAAAATLSLGPRLWSDLCLTILYFF